MRTGLTVLDIGTGSGILSIAARMLGASRVAACDDDPESVAVARAHVPAYIGSVDAVRSQCADVLVVNIGPAAVIEMADDILRSLRPGGIALVSGFERADAAQVVRAYPGGLLHTKHEWCLLEFTAA